MENIPSELSGRAIGLAKATATRERRAITVNCMFAVLVETLEFRESDKGRPATKVYKNVSFLEK
jgi:hypothetical protein